MIDALRGLTYMVRHSPNCPKRFEVRLSGLGFLAGFTVDDVGYGNTADEAASEALKARDVRRRSEAQSRDFTRFWEGL